MLAKKKQLRALAYGLAALAIGAAPSFAAGQQTMKQMASQVKTACQSDINKFCGDVTPGGGRVMSCLDSKIDKLSDQCRGAWSGAQANISHRMDKAEVVFRKSCGSDVQKFCSEVPSGQGRLLSCLNDHVDDLSSSCTKFQAQLDLQLSEFLG